MNNNNEAHPHFRRVHPSNLVHKNCEREWRANQVAGRVIPSCSYCRRIPPIIKVYNGVSKIPKNLITASIQGLATAAIAASFGKNSPERVGAAISAFSLSHVLGYGFAGVRIVEGFQIANQFTRRAGMFLGMGIGVKAAFPAMSWINSKLGLTPSLSTYTAAVSTSFFLGAVLNFGTLSRVIYGD